LERPICFVLLAALTPNATATSLSVVSSASYTAPLAAQAIASAFGIDLATSTVTATTLPLPTSLGNTTVNVTDRSNVTRPAPLFYVSPGQVNFQIPPLTALGTATVTITSGDGAVSTAAVQINTVAPGLYSANSNGQGVAAAIAVYTQSNGAQTFVPVATCGTPSQSCTGVPLDLSGASGSVALELFGTGIRGAQTSNVTCTVGGVSGGITETALYAGPQGTFVGLDQVNIALPGSLANSGSLNILCTVSVEFFGALSNTVTINSGAPQSTTADFYVAVNGNDSWSGTLPAPNSSATDGPFATPGRAQTAVRAILANPQGRTTPVIVMLRAGTYAITSPITLTNADSGTATLNVIWENYPGETPVIGGGRAITGWTPSATVAGAWQASIAGFAAFEQLWVGGQRRYRVRAPSSSASGYFYNLGPIMVSTADGCTNSNYKNGYSPAYEVSTGVYRCQDRFFFTTGDINPNWSGLNDPNHPIEIIDFEDWTIARLRLVSIGSSSGLSGAPANSSVAYLAAGAVAGEFWGFLPGHRYQINAVKEALSASTPGQWYVDLDSSGNPATITYFPAAGENFSTSPTIIAPQTNQLLVANDPKGVSYLQFQGITFSFANWVAGNPGYATSETSEDLPSQLIPAALSFRYAAHITLNAVTVAQVGGWGAEFIGTNPQFTPSTSACTGQNTAACNNLIVNSAFTDLGAGGIRLGTEPASTDTDANVAQYNLVYNTVLAGGSRMEPGVALDIENTHHSVVDHNDIYDFYNQGINLGRSLNFLGPAQFNFAHDNQITYNHVYQLGQGVTSDMGFVHTATGLQTGNIIEYNNFHDITHDPGPSGYGGWGIYFDQGSSFVTAMYNLVYNTSATGFTYNHSESGTYQLNGTPNTVANNIFAYGAQSTLHRNLEDGALNLNFKNNLVYWDMTQPMGGQPASPQTETWTCNGASANFTTCFVFAQNMYYSTVDPTMSQWRFLAGTEAATLAQWQAAGEDAGSSVNVDPLFVCPGATACSGSAAHNFQLQSGSPAPNLINFTPFDYMLAGRAVPVIFPPAVPAGFPLQLLPVY
jgi:uncharacterized protein (TIGR03437 family)